VRRPFLARLLREPLGPLDLVPRSASRSRRATGPPPSTSLFIRFARRRAREAEKIRGHRRHLYISFGSPHAGKIIQSMRPRPKTFSSNLFFTPSLKTRTRCSCSTRSNKNGVPTFFRGDHIRSFGRLLEGCCSTHEATNTINDHSYLRGRPYDLSNVLCISPRRTTLKHSRRPLDGRTAMEISLIAVGYTEGREGPKKKREIIPRTQANLIPHFYISSQPAKITPARPQLQRNGPISTTNEALKLLPDPPATRGEGGGAANLERDSPTLIYFRKAGQGRSWVAAEKSVRGSSA